MFDRALNTLVFQSSKYAWVQIYYVNQIFWKKSKIKFRDIQQATPERL